MPEDGKPKYAIDCYFNYHEHDLEKEIALRKNSGYDFSQEELWSILRSVVNACAYLQETGMKHGDIRPCHIVQDTVVIKFKFKRETITNSSKIFEIRPEKAQLRLSLPMTISTARLSSSSPSGWESRSQDTTGTRVMSFLWE